jgi:hypothetical protein
MKKIIITLAIIIKLTADIFAAEEKVNPAVMNAFNSKFRDAQQVTWVISDNYYKAAFNYRGAWMSALYTTTGKFISVTRNFRSTELPPYLRNSLKTKYAGYWITDLVEESSKSGFSYFITIENADKRIVLKSKDGDDWGTYHEYNKE